MADRNQSASNTNAKSAPSAKDDASMNPPKDGIAPNPDPDSDRATASRPRGHTEEPDRTL